MKTILALILPVIFGYITKSFVLMKWDPSCWNEDQRIHMLIIIVCFYAISGLVIAGIDDIKNNKL